MADVDLDVHGVRYAQIHIDLKRDMKLQGLGFTALLDFTTVDTLRASLERVITDKTNREGKVEAMCYYKKRRRGAVTIKTQRDVMLACCEYPLVTRTGKPAPDTYIRVGVALEGFDKLEYRNALRRVLTVLPTLPGTTPAFEPAYYPPVGQGVPSVIGSLTRVGKPPKAGPVSSRVVYRKILRSHDGRISYVAEPEESEPVPKRLCLAESMGWQLVGPSSPLQQTMEIKPLGSDSDSPDIIIPTPPSLPMEIKSEPLDFDDEDLPLHMGQNGHKNQSGHCDSPIVGYHIDNTDNITEHEEEATSADNKESKEEPLTDTTEEEGEGGLKESLSAAHHSDGSTSTEPGMRLMWEQLRKMETRLTDMEGGSGKKGSLPPPDLTAEDETSAGTLEFTNKIAALERRLLLMEQEKQKREEPLYALERRLAVMEKNISRTLSSVDKLGKSLNLINRKHMKTNSAVDVLCESIKTIRESQALGQSTLEQIREVLLQRPDGEASNSS